MRRVAVLVAALALTACSVLPEPPSPAPNRSGPSPSRSASSNSASASAPTSTAVVSPGPSASDVLEIATMAPGVSGGDALGGGTLGVELAAGTACFWVTPGGYGLPATALVWPHGFSARDDPVRVIGPDGQVLALVGDLVTLGGGSPPRGEGPGPAQDPCAIGNVFFVSSVGSVNGTPVNVGEGSLRLDTRIGLPAGGCPDAPLEPLMLVMWDERLQLRVMATGENLPATWPSGFRTLTDPIRIVDPNGREIVRQGVATASLRGTRTAGSIEVCGQGELTYP